MLIVDSQVHIWKANSPDRPWTPGVPPQLPEPMTIELLVDEMTRAGVDRAVIVPPGWEAMRNDYATEAFDKYPDRFRFMARLGLKRPDARALLPGWMQQRGNLGMRQVFIYKFDYDQVANGAYDWLWEDCERFNIPVSILPVGLRPALEKILDRHPQLKLTIDHMGLSEPIFQEGRVAETILDTAALARFPNAFVKVSSAPTNSLEKYPYRDMHGHIHRIVDAFGPQRCFWGSDLTHMRHAGKYPCSYRECVTLFTEELGFSANDLEWIMGRAICEHLGWPMPA
jgi:predicted TIM-barrel fold metal-dependent hydrolase